MKWIFNDNAPIYLQIVSGLQKAVVNGTYRPGEKLPSVRELAMEAGVNPNTMQRALAELERSGLVFSVRTSGRFVTEDEGRLRELRREQSEEIVAAFFSSLRGLGMNKEEILEAVDSWIMKHSEAAAPPGTADPAADAAAVSDTN